MKVKSMFFVAIIACSLFSAFAVQGASYAGCKGSANGVYVDKHGVMRDASTRDEVAYYGVNYTLPFAHAYRAVKAAGVNLKEAIDRDVYHIARLGLNAYRIHIWDVEITDAQGNLIENEHLDLLDYLIHRLEQRGISVILTAQTNFGNGYPERNQPTGGYSYNYEKCRMHDTEECVRAQERYLESLVRHKNGYTGLTYATDNSIIALEINNEPCHSGTAEAATAYINRMVKAARKGGFKKPLLYNVSHNLVNHTEAFFKANVQGTTYQWYPTGLVSSHTRHGNFLPNVEEYNIPFAGVKRFDRMARVVYEFDPGDIIDTYLYPAVARSFRTAGFQWITQFAYDPIDIADVNTEYQTHYLNLAYTPGKAIGMKIAAQVVQQVKRGERFAKYPQDTIFGDFMVSYKQNLAMLNDGRHYFHTNATTIEPKDLAEIEEVAGVGASPIVAYEGTGAYFIDKIGEGLWRVEVMPDVFLIADPFAKPSPQRKVAVTIAAEHEMTLNMPGLAARYHYRGVNEGNLVNGEATSGTMIVKPGVYVVGNDREAVAAVNGDKKIGNIAIGEFVSPKDSRVESLVLHTPQSAAMAGGTLKVSAKVIGTIQPDSVMIFPRNISFWNDHNTLYKMQRTGSHDYEAEIPIDERYRAVEYNIVTFSGGKAVTYPQGVDGDPLGWDFTDYRYYSTKVMTDGDPVLLVKADAEMSGIEVATIPNYSRTMARHIAREPKDYDVMEFTMDSANDSTRLYLRKYVGDALRGVKGKSKLCVALGALIGVQELDVALITRLGITYRKRLKVYDNGTFSIDVSELRQDYTALIPAPFPDFLTRRFSTDEAIDLSLAEVEQVEISTPEVAKEARVKLQLRGMWIE
ncbi:MAG: hypothetical protein ACI4UN_00315 [Muribaculaceae bacterium]